eukprot:g11732.t1
MHLSKVVCVFLLAVVARAQELQNCSLDAAPLTIGSTEDADILATSILGCQDCAFAIQWVGEVFVEEPIRITNGTSLDITAAGPGATVDGRAVYALDSTVFFDVDGTKFISNSAGEHGGAISNYRSNVSWDGDIAEFSSNSAIFDEGGAIYLLGDSTVSWDGGSTELSNNYAGEDGGAILAGLGSTVSWDATTTFSNNVAGNSGGALVVSANPLTSGYLLPSSVRHSSTIAQDPRGGTIYLFNFAIDLNFTHVTFEPNSTSGSGGAVAVITTGVDLFPATFTRCTFLNNKADDSGGTDVGGALRLGGTAFVRDCSFVSNSATSRGPTAAVVASANISGSSFERNELYCEVGSYREDIDEGRPYAQFEMVCFDCPDWDTCVNWTIERDDITATCEAPLECTSADADGVTLETLHISQGYWRATNQSDIILAYYNADAYSGDCSVDLLAATVIAALVLILAVAAIYKYLLSIEVEEGTTGGLHRTVLRAVPVQALKIVVVVWQILIQFADAASVTYPGAYQ